MRLRVCVLAGLAVAMAGMALAEAPPSSPRPKPRVVQVAAAPVPAPVAAPEVQAVVTAVPSLRPKPRPDSFVVASAPAATPEEIVPAAMVQSSAAVVASEKKGLFGFLRPNKRPNGLADKKLAAAVKVSPGKQAVVSKKGSVCGDPSIKGEKLASITAKVRGCGISDPVRITSVAGVRLSTPATVNCDTAKALKSWVEKGVEPVYGQGKVVQLEIFGSYSCRPRNNKKGAKVSEHGRGNAVDVGGLTFSNGKSVSVLRNYDTSMRKIHKAACGIFGTTLGPGSDGYHENHLHFDIARHRSGTYCR